MIPISEPKDGRIFDNARNLETGYTFVSPHTRQITVYSGDSVRLADPMSLPKFNLPGTVLIAPKAQRLPDVGANAPYTVIDFRNPEEGANLLTQYLKGGVPMQAYFEVTLQLLSRTALLPQVAQERGKATDEVVSIEEAIAEYKAILPDPASNDYDRMRAAVVDRFTSMHHNQGALALELNMVSQFVTALNIRQMARMTRDVNGKIPPENKSTLRVITPMTPPQFVTARLGGNETYIIPSNERGTQNDALTMCFKLLYNGESLRPFEEYVMNQQLAVVSRFTLSGLTKFYEGMQERARQEDEKRRAEAARTAEPVPEIRRRTVIMTPPERKKKGDGKPEPAASKPPAPEPPPAPKPEKVTIEKRYRSVVRRAIPTDARRDRDEDPRVTPNEKGINPIHMAQIGLELVVVKPISGFIKLFRKNKKEAGSKRPNGYTTEETVSGVEIRSLVFNRHIATINKTDYISPEQRTLACYSEQPKAIYDMVNRIRTEARLCGRTVLLEPLIVAAGLRLMAEDSEFFNDFPKRMVFVLREMRKSLTYDATRPGAWKGIPADSPDMERILLLTEKVIVKLGKLSEVSLSGKLDRQDLALIAQLRDIASDYKAYARLADQAYITRVMRRSLYTPKEDVFYVLSSQFKLVNELVTAARNSNFDNPLTRTSVEKREALRLALKAKKKIDIQRATADQVDGIVAFCERISEHTYGFKEIEPELLVDLRAFLRKTSETKAALTLPIAGGQAYFAIRHGPIGNFLTLVGADGNPTIPEAKNVVEGLYFRIPLTVGLTSITAVAETNLGDYIFNHIIPNGVVAGIVPTVLVGALTALAMNMELPNGETPASSILPNIKPAVTFLDGPSWATITSAIADAGIAITTNASVLPPVLAPLVIQLLNDRQTRLKFFKILEQAAISSVAELDGPVGQALEQWGFYLNY